MEKIVFKTPACGTDGRTDGPTNRRETATPNDAERPREDDDGRRDGRVWNRESRDEASLFLYIRRVVVVVVVGRIEKQLINSTD